jgi:hypothetical protein
MSIDIMRHSGKIRLCGREIEIQSKGQKMKTYLVTMCDGWKMRVWAESPEAAKAKAEKHNRHGDKAVDACECDEMSHREYV